MVGSVFAGTGTLTGYLFILVFFASLACMSELLIEDTDLRVVASGLVAY